MWGGEEDLAHTVLHEFIHARDDHLGDMSLQAKSYRLSHLWESDEYEAAVDEEAIGTHQQMPNLINFVYELFGAPPKNYKP